MSTITSCNNGSIDPYVPTNDQPWDISKVKHVYRRLGFGASREVMLQALDAGPENLIDSLFQEAQALPNTAAPEWGNWSFNDYADYSEQNNDFNQEWYRQAAKDIRDYNLKGRLTFFWLNHFVTQIESYNHAPYVYQYWDILQTHALGNFKTFVSEIGLNPAMLLFLNGFENTNQQPNENYARELYELFTLGQDNGYTQQDIEETSRALTGYNHWDDFGGEIRFDESTFDNTSKIIFGQEGDWGYDDVIRILFEEKAALIANYICTKLYTFFVSPDINESIINEMATTLIAQEWEITPVLTQLFKSEHFFDEDAIGMIIKSPYDTMMTFINEVNFEDNESEEDYFGFLIYIGSMLGQDIFQPIDVAGWQRDQDWINSSTLTGRWLGMEYMSWRFWAASEEQFRTFAKNLTNNSSDPRVITETIVNYFTSKPLFTISNYDIAESIFRWEVPENYYTDGIWDLDSGSAPFQVILLMQHIFRIPEFQLK